MPPQIVAAFVSAAVSIIVVAVSRLAFTRSDRRFPILVLIQQKLLEMEQEPPSDTNGGGIWFHNMVPKVADPLEPYFDQLRMVSFPRRNCHARRAWEAMRAITEESYNQNHPSRVKSTAMSKDELIAEIRKLRAAITKG